MTNKKAHATHKNCSNCEKRKTLDSFCKGNSRFGRASWCKECVAAKKREDRKDPTKRVMVEAQYERDRNSKARKAWRREDVLSGRSAERQRKSARDYYNKNREKILERRREESKDSKRKHQRKCNLLVSLMLYFGMLEREPCQICGSKKVEAAHRTYKDPLDTFWACPAHHRQYDNGWIDEHGNSLK